jgi:hypothetical protein
MLKMASTREGAVLAGVAMSAVLLIAGCGGDDEDEPAAGTGPSTLPSVGEVTNPAAPATQASPAPTGPSKAIPEPTPAPPTAAPNACDTDKAISQLKFTGVPCAQAAAVADEWNRMQDRCNTIDDPNSPEGYNRTCTVQSYTCKAKRDVKSDARFVACAKGTSQIRFTWAPA